MRWIHSTRPGQPFQGGLAAWTSAGSPRAVSWRGPARLAHGLATGCFPLGESCLVLETSNRQEPVGGLEAGPASGGNLAGCWTDQASEGG
jgi:hypothetical protein